MSHSTALKPIHSHIQPEKKDSIRRSWTSMLLSGEIQLSPIKLVAIVGFLELEQSVKELFGPQWLNDYCPSIAHGVLRLTERQIALRDDAKAADIERKLEEILGLTEPTLNVSFPKSVFNGQKRFIAKNLRLTAEAFPDVQDRMLAIANTLEATGEVLGKSQQARLLRILTSLPEKFQKPNPHAVLECATTLARAGFEAASTTLFRLSHVQADAIAVGRDHRRKLNGTLKFFQARLLRNQTEDIEELSELVGPIAERRQASYLLGVTSGNEMRLETALECMNGQERRMAVVSAVQLLVRAKRYDEAMAVACTTKLQAVDLSIAWPLLQDNVPDEIRDKMLVQLEFLGGKMERMQALVQLARLESSQSKCKALLKKAEQDIGTQKSDESYHTRAIFLAVSRILLDDEPGIAGLQAAEHEARKIRKCSYTNDFDNWSGENPALVAAGYFLAGDSGRAMEIFTEEKPRATYSLHKEDPSKIRRQTAAWLNYFGAYRLAYEIVAATPQDNWGYRFDALVNYGSAAARAKDTETVQRAQEDLGPHSLAAFQLRTKLFAAQQKT